MNFAGTLHRLKKKLSNLVQKFIGMTIETVEEHPVTEILDFCDGSQQGGLLVHYLSVLEKYQYFLKIKLLIITKKCVLK